jgi:NAD-dependent SIR2 family protein deacetylase
MDTRTLPHLAAKHINRSSRNAEWYYKKKMSEPLTVYSHTTALVSWEEKTASRTARLHDRLLTIFESASESAPLTIERLMNSWAEYGRLVRHYTQNIDCRASRFPQLS